MLNTRSQTSVWVMADRNMRRGFIMQVSFGDIFYNDDYYKGVVVAYFGDSDWWYVLEGSSRVLRAKVKPEELNWLRRSQLELEK